VDPLAVMYWSFHTGQQLHSQGNAAASVQGVLKIRELTVGNRLLKTQLTDNNLYFRNALETTHMYLLEGDILGWHIDLADVDGGL